ncbi:aminotransferase class I/II-fold pyridoxal phosphate-dependent enzyme [Pseudonocardia alni]|jgi:DNA-binding transcriptional MocR family regulator|uniref:DNA-binding transcriptional MocR family regulator n=1 Tax=Pseudonocardia alni TaxID=33907 RepID=A0AA44ZSH8_PSEA5|nr:MULTISPECIES: aminotransferase class I/II-fold pyridoxal phosphate-dependent enzyme [Pseudonocardia]MCO7193429.1 aminotransferase class I/II-fold pyridoxal phosphate-dependent enzyme [Pseudonocardia sp. McavD-2-B]MYW75292.1 aminotransferase class I/II-fold pyridoxal phosphate-dependent enzyme [Pseudonocardia sp. SID8383]OJG05005.1 putative aminotransferase [Pseudonocardia autotrophica]PKB33865.1 DNA-binding transcriptional MocR family regulator [Pseudonocardia alni]
MTDPAAAYEELKAAGLKLDLTRGKPSAQQLDLSHELLGLPGAGQFRAADGTDTRNYGGGQGLPELREIFAPSLQVPVGQLVASNNSSLELMHDTLVHALLTALPGAPTRWVDAGRVAFIAPVPGYDRHYGVCERLGIDLVTVPMTADGPDMDEVERLVAEDPSIKGIWCVPKYSNPDGAVYSDEVVRRLATMPTAAPDFRIMWDNAYAVHHLTTEEVEIADVLTLAAEAGNADRPFVFGSTSKITLAGAGVAFFGASQANVDWWLKLASKKTIGPDKVNHLRHALFLKDAAGLRAHMAAHRELIAPKFAAVDRLLTEAFSDVEGVSWTKPRGGYFVSLTVPDGLASEVVRLAKEAGVVLTPAGATHPYGKDPQDATIRLAPTLPPLDEVEKAMAGVVTCVQLALARR